MQEYIKHIHKEHLELRELIKGIHSRRESGKDWYNQDFRETDINLSSK